MVQSSADDPHDDAKIFMNGQEDKKTILLVEDEALIAISEEQALTKQGFDVIVVSSGERAIETVKANPDIGLILMDINLGKGKMDGMEAAEVILKERTVPVLFISAFSQTEVVEKAERITPYGYVVKGSGEMALLTSIKMAFKLHDAYLKLKEKEESFEGAEKECQPVVDITGHRRAEEALLESEAKYRAVVESSLVGVYIVQDGLIRYVNRRWCEIYGYTYDEIVDQLSAHALTPLEDRPLVEENIRKRLSGEADHVEYKTKAIRKDGKTITLNILGSPIVFRGRPAISGTVYDITEHERVEKQLRQKTALFEAQVNASRDGIIITDKGKKILQNQRAKDLLKIPDNIADSDDGGAQVEWVGGLMRHPEQFHERINHILAHPDETVHTELELIDGTILDCYSGPVIGSDGQHYGRTWTFRDITERKRSEESLLTSRLQLSEAMELSHIVYWEVGPNEDTFVFNDPFYTLYGTTAEREGGYEMTAEQYARRFVHPDDLAQFLQFREQGASQPGPEFVSYFEHRIVRRDGEVRHILARTKLITDDSGVHIKRSGANQDITDRKVAEDQIRSLLAEKELLLREVHHRIKNHMNVIMSLFSLQSSRLRNPAAISSLEDARSRVQSMMVLYDKLYRSHDFRAISTKEYLTSLVGDIVANFPNRGQVAVEIQIEDVSLGAKILSPVGMIVNELLTNTMKHAFVGRDKGMIRVSFSSKDGQATLVVCDDGVGIPESIDIEASIGFGMQLVGILTEQLNGAIRIEREQGTRFVLEFDE